MKKIVKEDLNKLNKIPWLYLSLLFISFLTYAFIPSVRIKPRGEKILGADISFLPELENKGIQFKDKGIQQDVLQILKAHGFNYIRLRIFNEPGRDSAYSPKKAFCDLEHTKKMAIRIKSAKMKFLLDFHYSDTWADPGKQFKPEEWKNLDFLQLQKAVHDFTQTVLRELKSQGTPPDMVQIGNEINHGMIWPDGRSSNMDTLTSLIKEGIAAVREVDPDIKIMLHIALGGQNKESRFFIDNMLARNLAFDVIGESYYPQWHGTLKELEDNLTDLSDRYKKDIVVVEYSRHKQEVNDIVFHLPEDRGRGTFIWEPLNTWESIFDAKGFSKDSLLNIYDDLSRRYKIRLN